MSQRKEIKDQKEEADSFIIKQNQIQENKTNLILWKIWKIKSAFTVKQNIIENVQKDIDEENNSEAKMDSIITEHKKKLASKSKMGATLEKNIKLSLASVRKTKAEQEDILAKIRTLHKKELNIKTSIGTVNTDSVSQGKYIIKLKNEIAELLVEESNLKNQLSTSKNALSHLDSVKFNEYLKLKEESV
jgi:chromosome segregation ATPase